MRSHYCLHFIGEEMQVQFCNYSFGCFSGPRRNFPPFSWVYCHKTPTMWPFCLGFLISFCLCTLCCFPEASPSPPAQHPPWQQLCLRWATESPAASREVMSSDPAGNPLRARGTWAHFSGLPFPSPEWPPMGPLCFSCMDQIVLHVSRFLHCPSRWQTLLFPASVQQQMKWNFNVSWSPLALLIKTMIITREVCKLATLATNRDTPNLAQIIAGSCLLSGYFNHWWLMPVRAIPGFDVPQTQEKRENLWGERGEEEGERRNWLKPKVHHQKAFHSHHPFRCCCYCICWGHWLIPPLNNSIVSLLLVRI